MGLLDDAIREHLDLKRRRGADPAEIERAERDALGPVRRGPEETDPAELGPEPGLAYDEQAEPDWGEAFEDQHDQDLFEPAPEYPPLREATAPAEPFADEDPELEAPEADPSPTPGPRPREPEQAPEHLSDETAEYNVEDALEREPPQKADDTLEETPEFLQDTPEHDRLWFEQRPPKDFDFNG
jgi:hypothetical protein